MTKPKRPDGPAPADKISPSAEVEPPAEGDDGADPVAAATGSDYPYLRAFELALGTEASAIQAKVAEAAKDGAPPDAVTRKGSGEWATYPNITPDLRDTINPFVVES